MLHAGIAAHTWARPHLPGPKALTFEPQVALQIQDAKPIMGVYAKDVKFLVPVSQHPFFADVFVSRRVQEPLHGKGIRFDNNHLARGSRAR
jgi:hypothetical protein